MNPYRSLAWLLLVAGALALAAASARPAGAAPHVVTAGDVLEVSIFAGGEKQQEFAAVVGTDGTMTVPLAGNVKVGGLATPVVASRLQKVLGRDYYVDPQVLVDVKQFGGRVFVLGEVKRPGAYDMGQDLGVLGACILAGGFTDYASLGKVKLLRAEGGRTRTIKVNLGRIRKGEVEDLSLQDGDRVEVPRRLF